MITQIKVLIIGLGRVAEHYKNIIDSHELNEMIICGVCDIDPDKALSFGAHWNCPSFVDINLALEKLAPDLVFILTPSGLHYEHALLSLQANCNVLVEKPIAMRPEQIKHLIVESKSRDLLLTVAFQNRFNPAIQCLKSAVDSGKFGKIVTATIRLRWCRYQSYYEDGWHGTWCQDGGVINQQAIHHVDALRWLSGPIERVCAISTNRINTLEAEDTLVAALEFKNGSLGTIEATTAARPNDIEASISIIGENGSAVVDGIALNKISTWDFINPHEEDKEIPSKYSLDVPTGYGLSHRQLIQDVITACRKSSNVYISAEDGLQTALVIHAIYKSIEDGCWVSLRDNPVSNRLGINSII